MWRIGWSCQNRKPSFLKIPGVAEVSISYAGPNVGKGSEDDIRRESEFLFRCYSDPWMR
jgi:hypothetical protein